MARLFSIAIPFNGQNHNALVTIRQQGCDLVCLVRYTSADLQSVLLGENLIFGLMEGLKEPAILPSAHAESLVKRTISAISAYLQVNEVSV